MSKNKPAAPSKSADVKDAILNGSSTLPALVDVGAAEPVQLGDIVAAAHAASGLAVDAWNDLPEADRDALLTAEVDRLKLANAPKDEAPKDAPEAPAPVEEPASPASADVEALREEIRASLSAHLENIDQRIEKFLDNHIEPMNKAMQDLEMAVASSTPEGITALVASVEAMRGELTSLSSKMKHFL